MKWAKRISYKRPKGCSCSSSVSLRKKNSKSRHSERRWSRPAAPNSMKAEDLLKWARDQTNTDMMTEPRAPRDLQKKENRPILSWRECHQSQLLRNWNSKLKKMEPRKGSDSSRIVRLGILKVRNHHLNTLKKMLETISVINSTKNNQANMTKSKKQKKTQKMNWKRLEPIVRFSSNWQPEDAIRSCYS